LSEGLREELRKTTQHCSLPTQLRDALLWRPAVEASGGKGAK